MKWYRITCEDGYAFQQQGVTKEDAIARASRFHAVKSAEPVEELRVRHSAADLPDVNRVRA